MNYEEDYTAIQNILYEIRLLLDYKLISKNTITVVPSLSRGGVDVSI